MNPFIVRSFFLLPLFALPAGAAAQAVPITVQLGGQTYTGSVTPTSTGAPTTQVAQPTNNSPTTKTADGAAMPAEAVQALVGGPVPLAVHLDAMDVLDPAALRDVRVTWDFGDPAGARNVLAGYNAAHAYDVPGTYTITRTVDSPAGRQIRQYRVTATPDARRTIYVSADGNDAASGLTPETAIRTWTRAGALIRPNTALLFRRGDRFALDRTLQVKVDDVRLASYGDAALPAPTIALSVPRNDFAGIATVGGRTVIEGLAFDSDVVGDGLDKKNTIDVINAGGRGLLVRGCTFRAVANGINGNGNPTGVLMIGNDAPLETGLRAYLAWVQGTNWTFLDNRAVNSTREHIIRVGGAERINITGNRFSNLDRRDPARGGDPDDFSKTTLNIQRGRVAWIAQNVLRDGPVSVGPLGGADGVKVPEARWIGATFEDNRVLNTSFDIQHGVQHVTCRNNLTVNADRVTFAIYDFNASYNRGCDDVTLERNTVVNTGPSGGFARVGNGATRVRLIRNAFVAPQLVVGSHGSSPVVVSNGKMDALTQVEGNRWGEPARSVGDAQKRGGLFLIGGQYEALGTWQKLAGDDKLMPLPDGTLSIDGAGVDASRLPAE